MSALVRSLIPTISTSPPRSATIRATQRPIRPKPLIPTFVAIFRLPVYDERRPNTSPTRAHGSAECVLVKEPRARIVCAFDRSQSKARRLFCGFLRVAKFGGHELEDRVGERNDVRAAVAAISKLSVDRLRDNPNATAVRRQYIRVLCSCSPHPEPSMMHFACHL